MGDCAKEDSAFRPRLDFGHDGGVLRLRRPLDGTGVQLSESIRDQAHRHPV